MSATRASKQARLHLLLLAFLSFFLSGFVQGREGGREGRKEKIDKWEFLKDGNL
jgi:hypothetical protein